MRPWVPYVEARNYKIVTKIPSAFSGICWVAVKAVGSMGTGGAWDPLLRQITNLVAIVGIVKDTNCEIYRWCNYRVRVELSGGGGVLYSFQGGGVIYIPPLSAMHGQISYRLFLPGTHQGRFTQCIIWCKQSHAGKLSSFYTSRNPVVAK